MVKDDSTFKVAVPKDKDVIKNLKRAITDYPKSHLPYLTAG
jgi:hypothetical protein